MRRITLLFSMMKLRRDFSILRETETVFPSREIMRHLRPCFFARTRAASGVMLGVKLLLCDRSRDPDWIELGVLIDQEAEADRSKNRGGGEEGATCHLEFSPVEPVSLSAN